MIWMLIAPMIAVCAFIVCLLSWSAVEEAYRENRIEPELQLLTVVSFISTLCGLVWCLELFS